MTSIRHRLLLWLTGALLLVALLVSILIYDLAWDGYNKVRDQALQQTAQAILGPSTLSETAMAPATPASAADRQVSQIWSLDNRRLYSSGPELPLPLLAPGLHEIEIDGESWHVYTAVGSNAIVQVANTETNRSRVFAEFSRWLLLPMFILVAVLGAMLSLAVGEALQPLAELRHELGQRDASALHPVPAESYPSEVVPLVDTVNSLLARLDSVLSAQQHFIAEAAHELRTPLTAIKLHAQLATGSPTDSERQEALERLKIGVDRAAHLVDQLLHFARFAPEVRRGVAMAPVELDALIRQLVGEFSQLADTRLIDLGVAHCDPLTVAADSESLRVLLGNLIDNALRYCRAGDRVDVELFHDPDGARLEVADSGPGIPDANKLAAFERFHRLAGADIPGSGLGLAIVREIVTNLGWGVALQDNPGGGLRVAITIPAASLNSGCCPVRADR